MEEIQINLRLYIHFTSHHVSYRKEKHDPSQGHLRHSCDLRLFLLLEDLDFQAPAFPMLGGPKKALSLYLFFFFYFTF